MNRYTERALLPLEKIKIFWEWFQDQAVYFKNLLHTQGDVEQLIFEPLGNALNKIQSELFFLLGYKENGDAELILTADGNIKNMFLIDALIQYAPQIEGWKIIGHKKAMDLENLNISIDEMEFNKDTLFFRPIIHEQFPDLIDIEIYYPDFKEEEVNAIHQGIYIFLDNYIGEINFTKLIDQIVVVASVPDKEELVPINKLKDYLIWREKEFTENYVESPFEEEFQYSLLSAELQNGNNLIAIVNTTALQWDAKASHPWVGIVTIPFEVNNEDQFPDEAMQEILEKVELKLCDNLTQEDGALHIGRQTTGCLREIYFTSKSYNRLAQVFYAVQQEFEDLKIEIELYKDKYWRTFDKYQTELN